MPAFTTPLELIQKLYPPITIAIITATDTKRFFNFNPLQLFKLNIAPENATKKLTAQRTYISNVYSKLSATFKAVPIDKTSAASTGIPLKPNTKQLVNARTNIAIHIKIAEYCVLFVIAKNTNNTI